MIDDEALRTVDSASPGPDSDEWDEPDELQPLPLLRAPESGLDDDLDAQAAMAAFAEKGLACSILSPQSQLENARLKPAFIQTSRRADALILDWNLNGDRGKVAKELIKSVLQDDAGAPKRRLRYIAIYTGEPDLGTIAEAAATVAANVIDDAETIWDEGEPSVAFTRGPVRLSLFAKEHVANLASGLTSRRRSVKQLPATVISEFSKLSMGLVTVSSLAALTAIREDAHKLLAALRPEMDPAVLAQRVALNEPEDVERQIEALIGSELLAIVQDHQIGKHVDLASVKRWLSHHKSLRPRGISPEAWVTTTRRTELLAHGLGDDKLDSQRSRLGQSKNALKRIRNSATELFVLSMGEAAAASRLFEERMSMRSRYLRPDPVLQLGSVIERNGRYAVCVQPLCDSVRLSGRFVRFPLLPVEISAPAQEAGSNLLFTVRDRAGPDGHVRLRAHTKPGSLISVRFAVTSGVVRAFSREGNRYFRTPTETHWRWLGDLKPEHAHAQRMVESLASQFSRVGLDEAEVLRLGL